ncbi:MAG: PEP-CTERM sorting domain-containing protein [Acidobacteria bacterium]|nr:PEP-CTERM sorting domain-containing protein [Acidobacteriota bacterium]
MKLKSFLTWPALCAASALAVGMAQAATINASDPLVPSGLGVGDTFHLIFVTSTTRDGNDIEIGPYNTFVNTAANAVGSTVGGVGATWYAIASTQGSPNGTLRSDPGFIAPVAAIDNAVVSAAVYLPDGTKIADDSADMWDATIQNTINIDEFGQTVGNGTQVWTGSRATFAGQWGYPAEWPYGAGGNATTAGFHWNALGDRGPGGYYRVGQVGLTNSQWINVNESNASARAFYALSEELTIIPEPSALALAGLGFLGLTFRRRRQTRILFRDIVFRIGDQTGRRTHQKQSKA